MKTLLMLRHAKSSWDSSAESDFERPLNARGEADTPRIAKALQELGVTIDEIVSSPARRALSTAERVADEIGFGAAKVTQEPRLYEAGRKQILSIVDARDDAHSCVLLVGHNPGFHDVVEFLSGEWIGKYPTAALSVLELEEDNWSANYAGCAKLKQIIAPKTLD